MPLHVVPSSTSLTVEQRCYGDCLTVRLSGELDLATRDVVLQALDRATFDRVAIAVLDLGQLTFIDCAGLGALMVIRLRVQATGGLLVVRNAMGQVALVLRATGADRVLQCDHWLQSDHAQSRPAANAPAAVSVDECPECHGPVARGPAHDSDHERVTGTCGSCEHTFWLGEVGWLFLPEGEGEEPSCAAAQLGGLATSAAAPKPMRPPLAVARK